ncbi:organic hydroperoxide resistance protein [Taibaiella soli]|uniref:Peroxiredoxin n=1 Tax=Taibaiella soli TaxID=1649169 RepID=A0A2W2AW43_9BACT|nr:organic hydroperoxide resistance protein [Taibaiella soli]PZF71908.1 peroxiredoxin [Taibaiella soli]
METLNIIEATSVTATQVLYTGKVHVDGGREGYAKSEDGRLDIALSVPGGKGNGTNPEQLFAAGWSACFIGAIRHNAAAMKIRVPDGIAVNAEVDLATNEDGFLLQARLNVQLPGMDVLEAEALVTAAHNTCPYSKATRGNISVVITMSN